MSLCNQVDIIPERKPGSPFLRKLPCGLGGPPHSNSDDDDDDDDDIRVLYSCYTIISLTSPTLNALNPRLQVGGPPHILDLLAKA